MQKKYNITRKLLYVALLITLIIGIGLGLLTNKFILRVEDVSLSRGTYIAGDQLSPNAIYLVIETTDNYYVLYRQFELIEIGTFSIQERIIGLLVSDGEEYSKHIYQQNEDTIYLLNHDGTVTMFIRIALIPTFINIEEYVHLLPGRDSE
ncbi:MAG: hypothetical protein FWG88_01830 [Oscillospiraceae bacterium]|nr:hypothetical protein [Oscillospiraceae bacterium]